MKIRKFQASNMRDALADIKRELGEEAMVVSTKQIRRGLLGTGVEVTAAIDVDNVEDESPPASAYSLRTKSNALTDNDVERIMGPLRAELRSIRSIIRPLTEGSLEGELRGELQAMRQLLGHLQKNEPHPNIPLSEIATKHTLVAAAEKRVTAIVGPTGVGKTTTIAKLAARAALVDKRRVAIITLDSYRVGGDEQIGVFADLIGVPLTLVSDASRLRVALNDFRDADRIFIDTAGQSLP